jgi:sugar/nucleoside kinase (ribokinase family)
MLAIGEYAASHNKLFAMNLSAPFLCQFYREPMDKVLPYVDILFANEPVRMMGQLYIELRTLTSENRVMLK